MATAESSGRGRGGGFYWHSTWLRLNTLEQRQTLGAVCSTWRLIKRVITLDQSHIGALLAQASFNQ